MTKSNYRANLKDFQRTLINARLFVFAPKEIVRLFGLSAIAVKFLLNRYTKCGITVRLKKGLHVLAGVSVPEFYIANRLCEPSYVSLETALSYHSVIPETVYAITSLTTRRPHERIVMEKCFRFQHVPTRAFTGYTPMMQDDFTVFIADAEKALVDYYYFVVHGLRQPLETERIRLENIDVHKIMEYAKLFNNHHLIVLLTALFPKSV